MPLINVFSSVADGGVSSLLLSSLIGVYNGILLAENEMSRIGVNW